MRGDALKVGLLAMRTGVSVRALHYYEEIGLLTPSRRTASGHRLYTPDDVQRLQQIVSLRQLGFSLDEVRRCLGDPRFSPRHVLELHLARLDEDLRRQQTLRDRLRRLLDLLRRAGEVSADEFIQTIEATTMSKYYTPEQIETLRQRRREVGEDRIRQVEQEWREVFDGFRVALAAGEDPAAPAVRALAERARGLIEEFTGGDEDIRASLGRMYKEEGTAPLERHGFHVEPEVFEYMGKAMSPPTR